VIYFAVQLSLLFCGHWKRTVYKVILKGVAASRKQA